MEPTQVTIKTHDELPLDVIAQALGLDIFNYEFGHILREIETLRQAEATADSYKALFKQWQAKVSARRERFPLAGQREFLRTLGPYLAEGIDLYHPATGRYGRLLGLPAATGEQSEPLADVEFYADREAREDGCGDVLEPYGKIVPVLYDPRLIAELYSSLPQDAQHELGGAAGLSGDPEKVQRMVEYINHWAHRIDVLRAAGLAVGLAPEQYQRRVVDFDYASGERPALGPTPLTFGEPLPDVTPCPGGRNDCPSGCPKCPAEMEVARA